MQRSVRRHCRDPIGGEGAVDFGEQQLKNIARLVRVYTIPLDIEGAKASGLEQQTLPLPDRPSIAVLPFANLSGDPEQAYCSGSLIVHWR